MSTINKEVKTEVKTEVKKVIPLNMSEKELEKDLKTLNDSTLNVTEVLIRFNNSLIDSKFGKWYDLTPEQLPTAFVQFAKKLMWTTWSSRPQNAERLGEKIIGKQRINYNFETVVEKSDADIKAKYGVDIKEDRNKIKRIFAKDYYGYHVGKWQKTAKELDNSVDGKTVAKKVRAERDLLETLAWNMIGEPDQYSKEGYSNSLLRKVINSKEEDKPDPKFVEKCFYECINKIFGLMD